MSVQEIQEMILDARERALAPARPWWHNRQALPDVYREATKEAGWKPSQARSKLLAEVYTWKDFFLPCIDAGVDGYALMVKQLREIHDKRRASTARA